MSELRASIRRVVERFESLEKKNRLFQEDTSNSDESRLCSEGYMTACRDICNALEEVLEQE